jgi:hypothetical protein
VELIAMMMPFGKFKGQPLSAVTSSYLAWCVEDMTALPLDLKDAILKEVQSRFGAPPPPPPPRSFSRHRCPDPAMAVNLIGAGLRALAMKTHPDRGGDTRQMQLLNATADWLKGVCR